MLRPREAKGATMTRFACALAMMLGCATPYQPKGYTGGYQDLQIGDNMFRVSFEGNGFTSAERTSEYLLLRDAEVTLDKGFRWFIIASDQQMSQTSGGSYKGGGVVASFPTSVNVISCFKEKPEGTAYDARSVANAL